jgi:DNA gyrase/topoisomerase IV subunit A
MSNNIEALRITLHETTFMFTILVEAMLHGQECRSRNKIIKILKTKLDEFDKERMSLLEKYGEKDADGKRKIDETGKNYILADQEGFNKEYEELLSNSDVILDILPSNKADFGIVKAIILNLKRDFNYADGEIYTTLCEKLGSL